MLTVDGQQGYKIKSGDIVTVKQAECFTTLVKLHEKSFFDVFKRKKCRKNGIVQKTSGGIYRMKISRHSKILEIIEKRVIETQEDLAEQLKLNGFTVTQATVSRDIKELKLVKVLEDGNRYKYAALKEQDTMLNDRLVKVFSESVLGFDYAGNIIAIKTFSGAGHAAAEAVDAFDLKEIVGTLAGGQYNICFSKKC